MQKRKKLANPNNFDTKYLSSSNKENAYQSSQVRKLWVFAVLK